ncbi:MAG: BREX-1 system adenine-specific DNA-methyltransferase PglX, partial [Chloroflexota bacterium]|nr:BREX-1 system adenine-specific DNA-methyltransferase PglX [Chloroflexota bacterium]
MANWECDGQEMKDWTNTLLGGTSWSRNLRSADFYFRPGITWSRRSQRGFSVRALPAGAIFSDRGPTAFDEHEDHLNLLYYLIALNSRVFQELLSLQMSFGSYQVGVIQATPLPEASLEERLILAEQGEEAFRLIRQRDVSNEISHVFLAPTLTLEPAAGLI